MDAIICLGTASGPSRVPGVWALGCTGVRRNSRLFPERRRTNNVRMLFRTWLAAAPCAALCVALCACSPVLDWRQRQIDGTRLTAMFPCKPSTFARALLLAGRQMQMQLTACSTDGLTWAISHAELNDPAAAAPALRALLTAAAANVGAASSTLRSWAPPGATPSPEAGRARFTGRRPDGRPLVSEVAVFAYGTQVFQTTVVGDGASEEALDTFFTALRLAP